MSYYLSAVTQKVHTSATCSMTRRNLARNLATTSTAAGLAAAGYVGCKRCGADRELNMTNAAPVVLYDTELSCGHRKDMTEKAPAGSMTRHPVEGFQRNEKCRALVAVVRSRKRQ